MNSASSSYRRSDPVVDVIESTDRLAALLADRRFISAEFMYQPPPDDPRRWRVFEWTLRSRMAALGEGDAVLFICDGERTADALAPVAADYPNLLSVATVANPAPYTGKTAPTPEQLGWEGTWERRAQTDRWCRILTALHVARHVDADGYLIMPAHDAVWGRGLLDRLVDFSRAHARRGLPAAVSPYTYFQHSSVPGADIPQDMIDLINTAFGRDLRFPLKIAADEVQQIWGKMGMIPFRMCGDLMDTIEPIVWEDDLEIDRAIRELGYGVRCQWIDDSALYRQALPVFTLTDARRVIERTLHYSLNVPATVIGASTLNFPLDSLGRYKCLIEPKFAALNARAEALIDECNTVIRARLDHFGASWVDWGAYRYVVRVGDAEVEVWRRVDNNR